MTTRFSVLLREFLSIPLFRSQLAVTMVANLTLAGIGMFTGILAARLLGPQGRGELTAIQTWPTFIAGIAMFGFPEAITYFSAKIPENSGRYLSTAVLSTLATSILFIAIGYFLMPYLLVAQSDEVIQAAQMYLLLIPIYSLVGMLYHPLRGRNDMVTWNILRLAPSIGWLMVLISAIALGIESPIWLARGHLIVLTILFLPVGTIVMWRIPGPYNPNLHSVKPMLKFGLPSMAASLPAKLNLRLDQMMMAALIAPALLGIYTVSVSWSGALVPIVSAIGIVAFPKIASRKTEVEQKLALVQSIHLGVMIGIGLCILLILLTPLVIPLLFGRDFISAIPSAIILIIASFFLSVNIILAESARGLGKPKLVLYAEIGGLVFTIVLLALLLKPLGIIGAAIASLIGYLVVCIILLILLQRIAQISMKTLLIPDRRDLNEMYYKLKLVFRAG